MPKIGDTIPLVLKLSDGDENVFVRCILEDQDGNALAESPVTLAHVGEGRYEDNSVVMPQKVYVTATYQVFEDAGFTIPSETHADSLDVFPIEILDQDLVDQLVELKALLDQILGQGFGANIAIALSENETVDLKLTDAKVSLEIEDEESIRAEISDETTSIDVESEEVKLESP